MEHAIELAKELLTFEFPANLTKKSRYAGVFALRICSFRLKNNIT